MRIARVHHDGRELLALEHEGTLYHVGRLDGALDAQLPPSLREGADLFGTRVFAMGLVGLDAHLAEIEQGTDVSDLAIATTSSELLPPCGRAPELLELREGLPPRPGRVPSRAVHGHRQTAFDDGAEGPLLVRPGVALVLCEDLHIPSPDEARGAVLGVTLALAWSFADVERSAPQLGPFVAREAGTHLGPLLHVCTLTHTSFSLSLSTQSATLDVTLTIDPAAMGSCLASVARHADLYAGDALLLVHRDALSVERGSFACLRGEALGELSGRLGLR